MRHPMGRQSGGALSLSRIIVLLVLGGIVGISSFFYVNQNQGEDPDVTNPPLPTSVVDNSNSDNLDNESEVEEQAKVSTRRIFFPNAETATTIVTAYKIPGNWDVSNLQQLVGHLEGTSWLGDDGNIVLAGHFEDEQGRPGPFRYLYFAQVGDRIIVQDEDANLSRVYEVTEVFRTEPDDLEVLRKSDSEKLTLITCDGWNFDTLTYQERLVVIAVPVGDSTIGDAAEDNVDS